MPDEQDNDLDLQVRGSYKSPLRITELGYLLQSHAFP